MRQRGGVAQAEMGPKSNKLPSQRRRAPEYPNSETDGMGPVGHVAQKAEQAEEEPNQHDDDCHGGKGQARRGVTLAADPDVAKKAIKNTGHAAKSGAGQDILAQVGTQGENWNQQRKFPGSLARFDNCTQVPQNQHVEYQVRGTEMNEYGRDQAPDLSRPHLWQPASGPFADQKPANVSQGGIESHKERHQNTHSDEGKRQRRPAGAAPDLIAGADPPGGGGIFAAAGLSEAGGRFGGAEIFGVGGVLGEDCQGLPPGFDSESK